MSAAPEKTLLRGASIITMDAACAWHNMFRGSERTLSLEAIHQMVAKETGLHPGALSDKVYVRGETFDPTKVAVQVGGKNFADTQDVKVADDNKDEAAE